MHVWLVEKYYIISMTGCVSLSVSPCPFKKKNVPNRNACLTSTEVLYYWAERLSYNPVWGDVLEVKKMCEYVVK